MEQANELVEKIIKEALADYLNEGTIKRVLKDVIRDFVREKFDYYFSSKSNEYINKLLEEEVKNYLKQEVNISDGWGKTEHYDSFEGYFKAMFKKKIETTYEIKRIIEDIVSREYKRLFEAKIKEITPKISEMVLNEMKNPSK